MLLLIHLYSFPSGDRSGKTNLIISFWAITDIFTCMEIKVLFLTAVGSLFVFWIVYLDSKPQHQG